MTLLQFFNFSILIVFDWMAPLCNIHVHVHTLLSNFLVLNSHIIEFFFLESFYNITDQVCTIIPPPNNISFYFNLFRPN